MAYFTFQKDPLLTIHAYMYLFLITKTLATQYKPFPNIKNETKCVKSHAKISLFNNVI